MILKFNLSDFRLLINLFKMALRDRFLGSSLGVVWAIVNPILMLSIFTFVFGFVFKTKLPGAETSLTYIIWLISGYGPWLAISEGIASGTSAVSANGGIIKNIAFKTELLPLSYSLLGLVPLVVSTVFLLILMMIQGNYDYSMVLLTIPILISQMIFVGGIVLFLSSLNVFIRDIAVVLPNILMVIMFASPIFYPLDSLPAMAKKIIAYNPIYVISDSYRQVILEHQLISPMRTIYLIVIPVVIFITGLLFFRKFKAYFDSRI